MHQGNPRRLKGYLERSFLTLLLLIVRLTRFANIFISVSFKLKICRSILLVISSSATQILYGLLTLLMSSSHGYGASRWLWHFFHKNARKWVERLLHQVSFVLSSLNGLHTTLHIAGWSPSKIHSQLSLQPMLLGPNTIFLQRLSLGIKLQKPKHSGWLS